MNQARLDAVLHRLRRVTQHADAPADGQLLERFIANRDEAAFSALVERHGRMVLGVCQRILGNLHDAEDAFQATFLVLARKADSVVPRDRVGNWLFGVARTTAQRARALNAKRRMREQRVREVARPDVSELRLVLDQELAQLSERHREVLLLCDLAGRTRRDVARQLRIPEGTVASRLAHARKLLAKRLARHGLPVAGVIAGAIGDAVAAPTTALMMATARAAPRFATGASLIGFVNPNVLTLTEGVLRIMATKLKPLLAVLLVLAIGLGAVAYHVDGQESDSGQDLQQAKAEIERLKVENAALAKQIREKGTLVTKVYPLELKDENELKDVEDLLEWVLGEKRLDECARYYDAAQCLIIRQPVEAHEQLRALFNELRKAKADLQKKTGASSH